MKNNRPVIFLDRDGTILNERGYLADPQKMRFYASALVGLRRLSRQGCRLIVLTNQSGVGRGYFSLATMHRVNREFQRRLGQKGIRIEGIFFCPHIPDAGCSCRKPKPGMARQAARRLGVSLQGSYMIGDQLRDVQLGKAILAQPILVLTGAGRQNLAKAARMGATIAKNLDTASRLIVASSSLRKQGSRLQS